MMRHARTIVAVGTVALLVLAEGVWACGYRGNGCCRYPTHGSCYSGCDYGSTYSCRAQSCCDGSAACGWEGCGTSACGPSACGSTGCGSSGCGTTPGDGRAPSADGSPVDLPPAPELPPGDYSPLPENSSAPPQPTDAPAALPEPVTATEPAEASRPVAVAVKPEPAPQPVEASVPTPAAGSEEPTLAPPRPDSMPVEPLVPKSDDPFSQGGDSLRTWTDDTGRHHVVARLVGMLDGDVVRLQKTDGGYVRVALDRLSTADQSIVLDRYAAIASR